MEMELLCNREAREPRESTEASEARGALLHASVLSVQRRREKRPRCTPAPPPGPTSSTPTSAGGQGWAVRAGPGTVSWSGAGFGDSPSTQPVSTLGMGFLFGISRAGRSPPAGTMLPCTSLGSLATRPACGHLLLGSGLCQGAPARSSRDGAGWSSHGGHDVCCDGASSVWPRGAAPLEPLGTGPLWPHGAAPVK